MLKTNRALAICLLAIYCLMPPVVVAKDKGQQSKPNKGKQAAPPNTVQGSAYGYSIDLAVAGEPYVVGPRPFVELPASGGTASDSEFSVSEDGFISSPTITVMTSGEVGATAASADSAAIIDDLSAVDGLIAAEQIVAYASSRGNATTASSNANGSNYIGLSIAGISLGNASPPPNSAIPLPGLGVAILNEQVVSGDGAKTSQISVASIHLAFDPLLQDSEYLEDLVGLGVIDPSILSSLLSGTPVNGDVLSLLRELDILNGPLGLPGGLLTIGRLEDLLDIDVVQELLDQGDLDLLLDEALPGGLLNPDTLQALLDDQELAPALGTVLTNLGFLEDQPLDVGFIGGLISDDVLSFDDIAAYISGTEFDSLLLNGESIYAWANSGVAFYAPGKDPGGAQKIHGIGRLGSESGQVHFGFDVELVAKKKQAPKGHLHLHDAVAGLDFDSHTITSAALDAKTGAVTFSGLGQVNGGGSYQFTAITRDVAQNGTGRDTFSINIAGPQGAYQRSGTLTAGDVHLHAGK